MLLRARKYVLKMRNYNFLYIFSRFKLGNRFKKICNYNTIMPYSSFFNINYIRRTMFPPLIGNSYAKAFLHVCCKKKNTNNITVNFVISYKLKEHEFDLFENQMSSIM